MIKITDYASYFTYIQGEIKKQNTLTTNIFKLREIKANREMLKQTKLNINTHLAYIDQNTTFFIEDFLTFLIEYMHLIMDEEMDKVIVVQNFSSEFKTLKERKNRIQLLANDFTEEICFVGKKEDVKKIKNRIGILSLSKAIEEENIKNYALLFCSQKTIHLADGIELKAIYQSIPYLKTIFERIIDLSITTHLSQSEKLKVILDEIRDKKFHLQK